MLIENIFKGWKEEINSKNFFLPGDFFCPVLDNVWSWYLNSSTLTFMRVLGKKAYASTSKF
ncbi:unnamed protein product [Meloidogyne enterolobii]|uniref:Uncharacterized protein n=1 Tax=Meloidogyne enterolobii TaxID=390850 RepID=A0ACB0YX52_MELEN